MVGRYLLLDELGSGAMGVVFSAFDPELNRKVAIKLLQTRDSDGHEDVQLTAQTRTRMVRETRALAQLACDQLEIDAA